ncbi:hypothetical protein [uncultured Brevundimonas sp.]|uniref:hypothetical protein n=1 Tax=uncultured Brevundimonas sp. TaxID=213418 RepID=UPI0030EBD2BC|tara:strand:+ start:225 stop:401 length:177 start_codon:yes stop_codon:yes gene_type:complete
MSTNEQRVLTNLEIASVSGANGVIAGPNGEGCIPPIVIGPEIKMPIIFPDPLEVSGPN